MRKLKEKVKNISRKKKEDHFYSLCSHECPILDVGIFPENIRESRTSKTNHFIKGFRYKNEFYTGLGIDTMDGMDKLYPDKRFVQYDGKIFPFKDKEFSWIHCNAVIEHVGYFGSQLLFLKEMIRTSENVFFTTPNKYFPMDAHTMVFFLHWNDRLFNKWRIKNSKNLPLKSLNLLSVKDLRKLLSAAGATNYKIIRNRLFGLTMTLTVIIKQAKEE